LYYPKGVIPDIGVEGIPNIGVEGIPNIGVEGIPSIGVIGYIPDTGAIVVIPGVITSVTVKGVVILIPCCVHGIGVLLDIPATGAIGALGFAKLSICFHLEYKFGYSPIYIILIMVY
jgi:hypothetical protein